MHHGNATGFVVLGDALFVCCGNNSLFSCTLVSGKLRW